MPTNTITNTTSLPHRRVAVAMLLLANVGPVYAQAGQAGPNAITSKTTVAEFALECQHPAKKGRPEERLNLCLTFLSTSVHQIALAKRSPKCWQEIESGMASPMALSDALFYLATQPADKNRQVGEALREIVIEVAAKSCK